MKSGGAAKPLCIVPIAHSHVPTLSLPDRSNLRKSEPLIAHILKVGRQLTLKHVQLMQSKARARTIDTSYLPPSHMSSGVDAGCSVQYEDIGTGRKWEDLKEKRIQGTAEIDQIMNVVGGKSNTETPVRPGSRTVTPVTFCIMDPVKAYPYLDTDRTERNPAHRKVRLSPMKFRGDFDISRRIPAGRMIGKIAAPLSKAVIPERFSHCRRRISSTKFTLEDFFYRIAQPRNSVKIKEEF